MFHARRCSAGFSWLKCEFFVGLSRDVVYPLGKTVMHVKNCIVKLCTVNLDSTKKWMMFAVTTT